LLIITSKFHCLSTHYTIFTPVSSFTYCGVSIHTVITAYQKILDVECTAMWSDIRTNGVSLWVGLPSMTKWLWKPNDT